MDLSGDGHAWTGSAAWRGPWWPVLLLLLVGIALWPQQSPRELQQRLLPVAGLVALGGVLAGRYRGPLRAAGASLLLLALATLAAPVDPLHVIPVASLLAAGAVLLSAAEVRLSTLASGVALLGLAHVTCLLLEPLGFSPVAWITTGSFSGEQWLWPGQSLGLTANPGSASLLLAVTLPWTAFALYRWATRRRALTTREDVGLLLVVALAALVAFVHVRQFGGVLALSLGVLLAVAATRREWIPGTVLVSACLLTVFAVVLRHPGIGLRLSVFSQVLGRITDLPPSGWLWGRGLGTWMLHSLGLIPNDAEILLQVHNEWIQTMYEAGLLGVVAFALLCAAVLVTFWRERRTALGLAGLVSTGAWLTGSLYWFPLHLPSLALAGCTVLVIAHQAYTARCAARCGLGSMAPSPAWTASPPVQGSASSQGPGSLLPSGAGPPLFRKESASG